eukprot:CAMPEP_0178767800 /NCGR_PEP_ID=MMETSP0744-20121128/19862_1 /TAXON_ID=913974 /ORGANISM="Nitzschia punctata, Strain CCMP561" /LENGTH=417 /DNA_ID=CAMNT_0020423755 /DNA_START=86 /DNA_END=1339 /DNA_ORIENTATION=+
MTAYLLLFDWRKLTSGIRARNATVQSATKDVAFDSLGRPGRYPYSNNKNNASYPWTWRVGAWIYSILALMMFVFGLLRIDYFPFSAWELYNWHPSEPAFDTPFTKETIKGAAHRCLTKPPLNPTCQNLHSTGHTQKFHEQAYRYVRTTAIVDNRDTNDDCPFIVLQNWLPIGCIANDDDSMLSLPDKAQEIMVSGSPKGFSRRRNITFVLSHERHRREKTAVDPKYLGQRLQWMAIDAVAASIEEGPECFRESTVWDTIKRGKSTTRRSKAFNPRSAASRFARQIRTHLSTEPGNVLVDGKQILSVGVILSYVQNKSIVHGGSYNEWNLCILGGSTVGENVTGTFGNHEFGNTGNNLPSGDFSEVVTEIFLILLLVCGIMWSRSGLKCLLPLKQKATSFFRSRKPNAYCLLERKEEV